jgi:hypothetical protein
MAGSRRRRVATRGSRRDRRFGGAVLGAARSRQATSGELWPLQAPAHHVIPSLYTSTCTSSLALFVLTAYPSLADHLLLFTPLSHSRILHITPQSCSATTTTTIRSPCMCLLDPPFYQPPLNPYLSSSPQGRIFQVEYAQEAVKQGSVVVGIVSKTHAVLAAVKVRRETLPSAPCPLLTLSSIA